MLSAVHCFLEGKESDLQTDDPDTLKQTIQDSQDKLLRDRICDYYYRFCYQKWDKYVELPGRDFIAEHVRVEYDVVSSVQNSCY